MRAVPPVTVFVVTMLLLTHGGVAPAPAGARHVDLLAVTLTAGGAVALLAARRYPLGAFVAATTTQVLLAALGYPVDLLVGPTVALYLLAAGGQTTVATFTVLGSFIAYLGVAAVAHGTFPGSELLHTGLAWTGAWFAGERTRLRREQVHALNERAVRAERDLDRERLLAVAEERARIARDLHDLVGHTISVIGVRAGAARLRHAHDPDRSLPALQAIEDLARHTVEEIDHLVATLRAESPPTPGELPAPPRLASLDTLISHHTSAGHPVTLGVTGNPRPLAAPADQAAYRIVQEALTNAARHGAGGAFVQLAYGPAALELTVSNPTRTGAPQRPEGGHGLIGMRERASLLGGGLDAVHLGGTFRIHASIPYGGHRT